MANDVDRSAGLLTIGVLNVIFGALGIIFYILVIIAGFNVASHGGVHEDIRPEASVVEDGGTVHAEAELHVTTETTAELEWRGWVGLLLTILLFISGFGLLGGFSFGVVLANTWAVCWIIWQIIMLIWGPIGWIWFILSGLVWPIIVLIVANTADGEDAFNQPVQA